MSFRKDTEAHGKEDLQYLYEKTFLAVGRFRKVLLLFLGSFHSVHISDLSGVINRLYFP